MHLLYADWCMLAVVQKQILRQEHPWWQQLTDTYMSTTTLTPFLSPLINHQSFTFGFPHCSHLMYLAVGGKKRDIVRFQIYLNVSNKEISSLSSKWRVGLTFLLGTEVLVGVPGSLLLLVFGECVSGSVRVLQRPLLTHGLLHLWTLAVTVGNWLLWPVRHIRYHYSVREMFVSNTALHLSITPHYPRL